MHRSTAALKTWESLYFSRAATQSKFVKSYFFRTVKTWFCMRLFLVSFN